MIHRTALPERPRKKRANNIFNSTDQHRGWIPQLPAQHTLPETLRAAPGGLYAEAGDYYLCLLDPMWSAPGSRVGPPLDRLNQSVPKRLRRTPADPPRLLRYHPLPRTLLSLKYSIIPELMSVREKGCLMTQTVTNPLVQMACERRAGTTRIRSCPAFRLGRPWLLTNLDGFWF